MYEEEIHFGKLLLKQSETINGRNACPLKQEMFCKTRLVSSK